VVSRRHAACSVDAAARTPYSVPMSFPAFRRAAVFLLLACSLPALTAEGRTLRVAAVQLAIGADDLASWEVYGGHIACLVERCLPHRPDLILFPEYTSAFLALLPYGRWIRDAGSVEEAFRRVQAREPLVHSLRDLLLLNSGLAERAAQELFGGLARKHGVAIGAGTWFACASSTGDPRLAPRLTNRAVIFDRTGAVLYAQDKVFLTPFEADLLGVEPGRIEAASAFRLGGRRIGLTICRDTFFAEWERRLAGAELWVDLQANGEPYTAGVRERFLRALPARLAGSGVPYGLSVCLTGRLLDLSWEGVTMLAAQGEQGPRVLLQAVSPSSEEILLVAVPTRP